MLSEKFFEVIQISKYSLIKLYEVVILKPIKISNQ